VTWTGIGDQASRSPSSWAGPSPAAVAADPSPPSPSAVGGDGPWAMPGVGSPPSAGATSVPPSPPRRRRRAYGLALAALVVVILVGAGAFALGRDGRREPAATRSQNPATTSTSIPAGVTPSVNESVDEPIANAARAVSPAVVEIQTDKGLGSGFIYDADGHVLTAAHVVDGADDKDVSVRMADGSVRAGKVLGSDDRSDVAVVEITDHRDLPIAKLALGEELHAGQTAVAIGSPFGLAQTVTAGIISALERGVATPGGAILMIQTDAPINPGNSGGALINIRGEVIGVNDSIQTETGSNAGVGFAIPAELAKRVADRIVAGEPVLFAFLGVQSSDNDPTLDGALVVEVESGSPADKAGLLKGDRVTALDGGAIRTSVDLTAQVRDRSPGDQVTFTVKRDGDDQQLTVVLGSTK
jgi:putative serine protease PepD